MNEKQKENAILYLENAIESVRNDTMKWYAISMRFSSGSTLAIHTEGAPKRPKGLS